MEKDKGIIFSSLDDILKNSMIAYAEDVILDRALPRVEDGLKPVQRRILYAMYEMGLTPDKPHKKCAKIVGDCLGKYHPHGDSSVYGALVHMAQDFNMRMPLIDGHGNFGTIDGDSAAAYRYTEARLSALSLELLKDIEKDTVNFSLNFDDSMTEPDTLPGRFPNLLVNGATGIAVGLATNIPTHNLGEVINGTVAFIDNPKMSLKQVMKYIPAPDFPTGGYIVAGKELEEAYKTGRGKIKIRARVNVEKEGEKQSLIISELPYQVNKADLLKKISDMRETKKEYLGGIADVVDESDRNGMRAVIKLRKDADPDKILAYLFKNTALETTFGINMVAIAHGKPCQMGLIDIISYYVNYQREVVLRRSKYDLDRAKERAHILEGLIIAVKNIDEVVRIIKTADNTADARAKLRVRFDISEVQANAILDLRLARLTKLEVYKLEEELAALKKTIEELTAIIGSKTLQMEVVKKEMLAVKKKFPCERRSRLMGRDEAEELGAEAYAIAKPIEDFAIGVTYGGTIKKMTEHNFAVSDKKVKDNAAKADFIKFTVRAKSDESVIAFTNLGNAVRFTVEAVPECRYRDKGAKLTDICGELKKNETFVSAFVLSKDDDFKGEIIFVTKTGLIKKTAFKEYDVNKSIFAAIKLKDGDEVLIAEKEIEDAFITFITRKGIGLNVIKTDVPVQGRIAGGVKGINLNGGDSIVFTAQTDEEGEFAVITDTGYYKRVIASEIEPLPRNRKGVKICDLGKVNNIIFAAYVKEPFGVAVIDNFGVAFTLSTEDFSIESRTSKGKQLKNENKKRLPETAFKLV